MFDETAYGLAETKSTNNSRTCSPPSYHPARTEIEIYGSIHQASIDTGSSLSFISETLFDEINRKNPNVLTADCNRISSAADSSVIETKKATRLDISLGGYLTTQTFYVANGLIIPIVLGTDFLMANRCILDFRAQEMIISDTKRIKISYEIMKI